MEKEYIVVVKRGIDLDAFDSELAATTGMGPIPNRSVEVANPRIGSKRMTHWMLTDEEAEVLKGDLRVLSVEIPPDQRDDVIMMRSASQSGTFYRSIGGTSPTVNQYVNWGLRRCIEKTNPYGNNNTIAGNYDYALDGTGVDVVIQDSGIDPNHPEWNNTSIQLIDTVKGGTATLNFVDNNRATYDLYVPYFGFAIPNYLASTTGDPAWASGQYDGAEFLIRFVLANGETIERNRIFGGVGTGTVTTEKNTFEIGTDGTIAIEQTNEDLRLELATSAQKGEIQLWLLSGGSRLRQIDWYTVSGISGTQSTEHYRDRDGHGSHCAGIAAGSTYGWAKGANIYSQKLAGLETLSGSDNTGIAISDAFDAIRLWHNGKTSGRPTVVNMSWNYGTAVIGNPASGIYRGTAWTYGADYDTRGALNNATGIAPPYFDGGTQTRLPLRIPSIDAEIEEMIDAGIHVCIAAGNNFTKVDIVGGVDYDNEVTFTPVTANYHRGASPYSDEAYIVGNIDSQVNINVDRPSVSSNKGPGVNIFAPGDNIISVSSTEADSSYTLLDYPSNTTYKIMSIGGTSMASPQVAGVCALYLQAMPNLRPEQLKNKIEADSAKDIISDTGNNNDYSAYNTSLLGGPNRHLYSKYGIPTPWGLGGTINISGGS
jgi:subtilisin family serine protease